MFFRCWRRLSCAPLSLHCPFLPLLLAAFLAAKRVQSPQQQHSRKAANLQWGPKMVCILLLLYSRFVAFIVCLHTWPRVAAGVLTKTNSRPDASALLLLLATKLPFSMSSTLLRCWNTHSYEIPVTNSAVSPSVSPSVLAHSKAAVKIAEAAENS